VFIEDDERDHPDEEGDRVDGEADEDEEKIEDLVGCALGCDDYIDSSNVEMVAIDLVKDEGEGEEDNGQHCSIFLMGGAHGVLLSQVERMNVKV
jgi:hypothetical protein